MTEWGYEAILFLQSFRAPVWDALFRALSFLGEEEFYLLVIPLTYWLIDKRVATRFALLVLFSAYVNYLLKAFVASPRPSPERVTIMDDLSGDSLPSGHAQNGIVGWGYVASVAEARWFRGAMAALIFGIGLSRVYLGVHFPQDILAGWLAGGVLLLLYLALAPRLERWMEAQSLAVRIATGAGLILLLVLLFHTEEVISAMGALFGMAVAVPLEREYVRFDTRVEGWPRALGRLLLGAIVLLLVWQGLKPLFDPLGLPGDFVRYALVGVWASMGAPWAFVVSGLARSVPASRSRAGVIP